MPRNKMKTKKLLKREEYRSIINLMRYCGLTIDKKTNKINNSWLTFGQIYWALSKKKNYDNEIEKYFSETNFFKKDWYGQLFNQLYSHRVYKKKIKWEPLVTRCIKTPQQLIEKLNILITRGYIEIKGKPRYRKYGLSSKYGTDEKNDTIKNHLDNWKPEEIFDEYTLYPLLGNNIGFQIPDINKQTLSQNTSFLLCGIPMDIIWNLNKEEKTQLNNWILNIEKNLWKIMDFKYKKMKMTNEEYYNYRENIKTKEESLHNLYAFNKIGFYYTGEKLLCF